MNKQGPQLLGIFYAGGEIDGKQVGNQNHNTQTNEVLTADYQAVALSVQESFVDSLVTTRPALGQGNLETRPLHWAAL